MIIPLCKEIADNRKGKAKEVIFCPVGDKEQLKDFITNISKLDGYKDIDYFFLYKKGMQINPKSKMFNGLSVIHAEEDLQIGTSGAFFVGSYALFNEGYEVIVISDIDAVSTSKQMLRILLQKARELQKVVAPLSKAKDEINESQCYNTNQWGAFPRSVFETLGFYTPYTWRGGEDFDLKIRLEKAGLISISKDIFIYHQHSGYTIFHKIVEKKKFYPYVAGLMKAFLLQSQHDIKAAIKFLVWYLFYAFFADAFSDNDLVKTLKKSSDFLAFHPTNQKKEIEIKKVRNKGVYLHSSSLRFLLTPAILTSLLLSKKALVYTDEIILQTSRINLLLGLIKATILIPWRILQAFSSLFSGIKTGKKLIYPVKPENAKEAIEIYKKMIR